MTAARKGARIELVDPMAVTITKRKGSGSVQRTIYLDKGLVWHLSGDLGIGIFGILTLVYGTVKILAGDPAERMRREIGEFSTSGYIMVLLGSIWIIHAIRQVFVYRRDRRTAELQASSAPGA